MLARLNPLLLTAKTGVSFQPWYRGSLEGIASGDLAALLPFTSKLNPLVALHTVVQGRMQRAVSAQQTRKAQSIRLSKTALTNNLRSMRGLVSGLEPPATQNSPWQDYERNAQYTPDERAAKVRFVGSAVSASGARTVWGAACTKRSH